ncbi:MAG: tetratricopeptide repeat protein, partial [Deltaproteobacteria bacterium]|nr:tetratricopeptide repeat protein [Deltaproteobacteria bacterium]
LVLPFLVGGCANKAAITKAESAVMTDPNAVEVWVMLGDTYKKAGRTDDALGAYQRALSLDPGSQEVQARIAGLGSRSLGEAERLALANPMDDEVWGDLADEYGMRGETDTALEYYIYALRIDPSDSEWQRKVVELGGIDQVAEVFESQIDGDDDEAIGDFADMLSGAGQMERACELYARANEIDPNDSEWREKLSGCPDHEPIGGYTEPGPDYPYYGPDYPGGVIGMVPDGPDGESLVAMGRSALVNGEREQALQYFQAALLQDPTDRDALTGVMVLTGKTLVDVLELLAERIPNNDELQGDLADAYVAVGEIDSALQAYRRASELDPSDSEWRGKLSLLDPTGEGTGLPVPMEQPLFELPE